jgi:uncharacterized protein with von Willebrand factor type A (vWA) domain
VPAERATAVHEPRAGAFADNVVGFARLLRAAGMPVGVDRGLFAVQALEAVGIERREDVRAALSAVLLSRREQQPLFDAAFDAYWRGPDLAARMQDALAPDAAGAGRAADPARPQRPARLEAALRSRRPAPGREPAPEATLTESAGARMAWSDRERLQHRDFDGMTADEFRAACRLVEQAPLPVDPVRTRRWRSARSGPIDLRATLLRAARDPLMGRVARRARRERLPPLVVLCDVSGSMERYARILLHYAHALARRQPRIAVFAFGTQLTDITRSLRHRDPDQAVEAATRAVADWNGGTRIGASLAAFNRSWARRVLSGNATVLLMTDGLDRGDDPMLGREAARLSRFAHRLVWLNPLLRFEGFEPRASGVRALLPHVDRHLPVHSLASLDDLGRAIRAARSGPSGTRRP